MLYNVPLQQHLYSCIAVTCSHTCRWYSNTQSNPRPHSTPFSHHRHTITSTVTSSSSSSSNWHDGSWCLLWHRAPWCLRWAMYAWKRMCRVRLSWKWQKILVLIKYHSIPFNMCKLIRLATACLTTSKVFPVSVLHRLTWSGDMYWHCFQQHCSPSMTWSLKWALSSSPDDNFTLHSAPLGDCHLHTNGSVRPMSCWCATVDAVAAVDSECV